MIHVELFVFTMSSLVLGYNFLAKLIQSRYLLIKGDGIGMVLIYNTAQHGLLRLILVLFIYAGFYAQHTALAVEEPTSSNNNSSCG
jgi:hypothetical protein